MQAKPDFSVAYHEDGLRLEGTILWFDAQRASGVSFLSTVGSGLAPQSNQVIATDETLRLLEVYHKKPRALVCQYNRPFSIGRLNIELLPSGCCLGGASLYVETEQRRLLYAAHLQAQKVPTVRQMQVKRANTLVLGAFCPERAAPLPNRRKEKERLLASIESFTTAGDFPIVLCNPLTHAQELIQFLNEHGVSLAVHPSIHRINRVYEAFGSKLGSYSLYSPRHTKRKVIIFPSRNLQLGRPRRPPPEGPVLVVDEAHQEALRTPFFRQVAGRFQLSSFSDCKELREVIQQVAPREIFLFGPYQKRYAEEFKGLAPRIQQLYPDRQPSLF